MPTRPILADNSTTVDEFRKNPIAAVEAAHGLPVAVLNNNQPAFYCIPAEMYEALVDKLDDLELAQLVTERKDSEEIEVNVDDL